MIASNNIYRSNLLISRYFTLQDAKQETAIAYIMKSVELL